MINTKIEINFQTDDKGIPYGENKPSKNIEEYKNFIEEEIKTLLGGLYPEYKNLKINVTTDSLA